jgi:hypothetical protein
MPAATARPPARFGQRHRVPSSWRTPPRVPPRGLSNTCCRRILSRRGGRRATQNLNRSREQLVAFVLRRTAAAAPPVANNLALLRVDHWQRRGQHSPAGSETRQSSISASAIAQSHSPRGVGVPPRNDGRSALTRRLPGWQPRSLPRALASGRLQALLLFAGGWGTGRLRRAPGRPRGHPCHCRRKLIGVGELHSWSQRHLGLTV